jgi:dTDP-4-dehydrorhamnose reductase
VVSAHGANFVKTTLRLGRERDSLTVVADQTGALTPAAAIADAVLTCAGAMAEGTQGGTYHFVGTPDTTWAAAFARAIMAEAGLPCRIEDIPTSAYPTPARHPKNWRLDCSSLTRDFGIARPDWRLALAGIVKELQP